MKFSIFLLLSILPIHLQAQTINPQKTQLYNDNTIPRINIQLPADSLAWILDPANKDSDYHFHARFVFDNGTVKDTIENVGFRLRGNTSRNAFKKSFKVSFNTYQSGRKYYGVEKLNLNGEHNDPSVARSKMCWDFAREIDIPAARANHVNLYINGAYFGVYLNVEHIDEEFVESRFNNKSGNLYKCLYPADLAYKGANPDLYKEVIFGRRAYELKTNEAEGDYSDLAEFIDVLNNTPLNDLPCELEKVFHVDRYLKAIAFDILVGNWDGPIYNKNNFYLYHNPETDLFEYIPFDLDNTVGIDWLGPDWATRDMYAWAQTGETRPIYTQLMAVPAYKARFSFYMNEMIQDWYNETQLFPYLDSIKNSLTPWIAADTFYFKDYGFTPADFQDAYDGSLGYFHIDQNLAQFITARRNATISQLVLTDIEPIITDVSQNHPIPSDSIKVSAQVRDDNSVTSVEFCYYLTDPTNVICLAMNDDGMSSDGIAGDEEYGIIIPPLNQSATLNYYLKATDNQSNESRAPICDFRKLFVGSSPLPLAINEIMASNATINADEFGEYDDWVEIHNYGTESIYLGDKYLSDKASQPDKWAMPDVFIQAGEYLLFWTDDDDGQGDFHTNFKLDAKGEYIGIFDTETSGFAQIDGMSFGEQTTDISYGRIPNGIGSFQSLNPTPAASNTTDGIESLKQLDIVLKTGPNPFHEKVGISIENPQRHVLQLEVIDLIGKSIIQTTVSQSDYQKYFSLAHLSAGMYVFLVRKEGQVLAEQKWVKN